MPSKPAEIEPAERESDCLLAAGSSSNGAREAREWIERRGGPTSDCDEICGGWLQRTVCPGHTRGCAGRFAGETATDEIQLKCFTCK